MTIFSKGVDGGGIADTYADETDTIDVGGFSDVLNVIGAKTAKFSGGSIMQANSGLRIGLTQLKVNSSLVVARTGVVISGSYNTNNSVVVVDFGIVGTANIKANVRHATGSNSSSALQISDDNITYVTVDSRATTSDTSFTHDGGVQTYRFARVVPTGPNNALLTFLIFEVAVDSTATYNIRSSTTQDTPNGSILVSGTIESTGPTQTFDTELLLTGNPTGDFVTLEIISFSAASFDVTLSDITSIKEV